MKPLTLDPIEAAFAEARRVECELRPVIHRIAFLRAYARQAPMGDVGGDSLKAAMAEVEGFLRGG